MAESSRGFPEAVYADVFLFSISYEEKDTCIGRKRAIWENICCYVSINANLITTCVLSD